MEVDQEDAAHGSGNGEGGGDRGNMNGASARVLCLRARRNLSKRASASARAWLCGSAVQLLDVHAHCTPHYTRKACSFRGCSVDQGSCLDKGLLLCLPWP